MSENRLTLDLQGEDAARQLLRNRLWVWLLPKLREGHKLCLEVVFAKTREQENLYHSCFADLSRDCLFHGEKVDLETWKRALLQAFYDATKDDAQFIDDWRSRRPRTIKTLDGEGLLWIGVESKRFTKNLAGAFIEFVHATGDMRGVRWSQTSLGRDWPAGVS